jgi:hypothetical protein
LATTPHEELLRLLADYQQPLMLGGHSQRSARPRRRGEAASQSRQRRIALPRCASRRAAAHVPVGRVRARSDRLRPSISGASPDTLRRRENAPANNRERRPTRCVVGGDVGARRSARSAPQFRSRCASIHQRWLAHRRLGQCSGMSSEASPTPDRVPVFAAERDVACGQGIPSTSAGSRAEPPGLPGREDQSGSGRSSTTCFMTIVEDSRCTPGKVASFSSRRTW